MVGNNSQEVYQHKQKAWEHICTVVVLVAEYLAVKRSIGWLAWTAGLFLWFAAINYARHYLAPRLAKIAIIASIPLIFGGTYYLIKEPKRSPREVPVPTSQTQTPPAIQQPPSSNPQPSTTPNDKPNKRQQSTAKAKGDNNTTGAVNQKGDNNAAIVGSGNFQNTGNITQTTAPCSVAQIGNNNTATVNCAPPSGRELAKFGAGTVVQVVSADGPSSSNPIGTGFWLNDNGYIATCVHSLGGHGDIGAFVPIPPLLGQNLTVASSGITTGVEPIIMDKEIDIAILHVIQSPFERSLHGFAGVQKLDEQGRNIGKPEVTQELYWVPGMASDLPTVGDEIIRVAFIQQHGMPVVNYDFGHITRMGVDSHLENTRKSYRIYTSVPFKDYDCGAPLINNAQTVIGMISGSDGGSSVAIPSSYILDVLKKIKN